MTLSDNIKDYQYPLPAERIALFPLEKRDQSKLLICKHGKIEHRIFHDLPSHLPEKSFLFFNDTKVIPARLHFQKETGAGIEIFLLQPMTPSELLVEAMQATQHCTWQCTIGNLKKWNAGTTLTKKFNHITFSASLVDREKGIVQFNWNLSLTFAEVITQAGAIPLPPYIKRKPEDSDKDRYQTIYSHNEGAVAAPTAGLHFTNDVFRSLSEKNIHHDFLTLHVSAGTFQPVKAENINEHEMHHEQIVMNRRNIDNILAQNRFIIPVGTTSMRTLESLYWFGVKLLHNPDSEFTITQHDPYKMTSTVSRFEAFEAIQALMIRENKETLVGHTAIFIKPGYRFRACDGLITNFHQPGSTLILLVAALMGEQWKTIYEEALKNDYRFLSYGDSSLLIP